jgi:hypothetical protein
VIRTGKEQSHSFGLPQHLKYDQTQKAPYTALLDRLKAFLSTSDTLLISIGFSYADSHVAARINEGLAANASSSVFAFQYRTLAEEGAACDLASKQPNFSIYAHDQGMMNGVAGKWQLPSDLPSKDWAPIRSTYWGKTDPTGSDHFLLGAFEPFARFFASSRS